MESQQLIFWLWLLPLITGVTGIVIGYYYGKSVGRPKNLESDMAQAKIRFAQLEAELKVCRELKTHSPVTSPEALPFNAEAARKAFGRTVRQNDLKIVEGIGPKIEGLFHNYDIKTWKALSETSVMKCQEVLDSGGERYRVHDPASWPMQAKMCVRGKWKELLRWQEEHLRGKL